MNNCKGNSRIMNIDHSSTVHYCTIYNCFNCIQLIQFTPLWSPDTVNVVDRELSSCNQGPWPRGKWARGNDWGVGVEGYTARGNDRVVWGEGWQAVIALHVDPLWSGAQSHWGCGDNAFTYKTNALLGIIPYISVFFLSLRVLDIYIDYTLKGDLIQIMSPQSLTVWGKGYTWGTLFENIHVPYPLCKSFCLWWFEVTQITCSKGTSHSISSITGRGCEGKGYSSIAPFYR